MKNFFELIVSLAAKNKSLLYLILLSSLLISCGVKKPAAHKEQQTNQTQQASLSLEQRVSAGEFAWLDSLHISSDTIKMGKVSGIYNLTDAYDSTSHRLTHEQSVADSLILSSDGYFWKYKETRLVDYGRYGIRKGIYKICMSLNYSEEDKKQHPELTQEKTEYDIQGLSDMVIDMYDYTHTHKSYWIRCFEDGREGKKHEKQFQHLCFLHDMNAPECFSFNAPKDATYWIINH